ncbi:MAG: hypothetical protein AAGI50_13700 [Pseudomonadota bacterium]
MIISHAVLPLPHVTISIGLQATDRANLDAAATMGVAFRMVVFSQTKPYALLGIFFALILSFNAFIVMVFVSASAYSTVALQNFNLL